MRQRLVNKCPKCGLENAFIRLEYGQSSVNRDFRFTSTSRCSMCGYSPKFLHELMEIIPRPSREVLHMNTAKAWAERSTCKQSNRSVGCVITPPSMDEILAFGYNGPSRSRPNDSCSVHADQPHSNCSCIHAEVNALLKCGRKSIGAIMFVTLEPCFMCAQAVDQAYISKVYYSTEYRTHAGVELLRSVGVEVEHFIES